MRQLRSNSFRNIYWIGFAVTAIVVAIPLFSAIGQIPLQLFDESRNAVNAAELLQSENWFVTTYGGAPDMWNTKPPLVVWTMALSMKLFGVNELGARLPSVVSSFITGMLLYHFGAHRLKKPLLGFLFALMLICTPGFLAVHCAKYADFDPMMVLFGTAGAIALFAFLEDGRNKQLFASAIFFASAILCKSIAGVLLLPGLFLFVLLRGKLLWMLQQPRVYIASVLIFLPVVLYYFTREHFNPGYVAAVMQHEWGGRFGKAQESNSGNAFYYLHYFNISRLLYPWFVLPAAILALFKKELRLAGLFALLLAATHLAIISSAATKLFWYDLPEFPFIAILLGLGVYTVADLLRQQLNFRKFPGWIASSLFITALLLEPYRIAWIRGTKPKVYSSKSADGALCHILQRRLKAGYGGSVKLMYDGYYSNILFYRKALSAAGTTTLRLTRNDIQPGDTVYVFEPQVIRFLEGSFRLQKADSGRSWCLYVTEARK